MTHTHHCLDCGPCILLLKKHHKLRSHQCGRQGKTLPFPPILEKYIEKKISAIYFVCTVSLLQRRMVSFHLQKVAILFGVFRVEKNDILLFLKCPKSSSSQLLQAAASAVNVTHPSNNVIAKKTYLGCTLHLHSIQFVVAYLYRTSGYTLWPHHVTPSLWHVSSGTDNIQPAIT